MIKTGEGCKKPSSVFSIFTRPITAIKMTDAPLYTPSGEHCSQSEMEAMHELILLNDQENTFCHVIESLIRVCGHEEQQAEQCALIAHNTGSCVVKTAPLDVVTRQCNNLKQRGLYCKIN